MATSLGTNAVFVTRVHCNWSYLGNATSKRHNHPEEPKKKKKSWQETNNDKTQRPSCSGRQSDKQTLNKYSNRRIDTTKTESPTGNNTRYSEPALQRQHLFPKTLPLKWIYCCTEYIMSRLICKKGLVLSLFSHIEHMFWYLLESPHWGDSNKYWKHMFL